MGTPTETEVAVNDMLLEHRLSQSGVVYACTCRWLPERSSYQEGLAAYTAHLARIITAELDPDDGLNLAYDLLVEQFAVVQREKEHWEARAGKAEAKLGAAQLAYGVEMARAVALYGPNAAGPQVQDTTISYPHCPNHVETQHRDARPPWCNKCGWNRGRAAVPARQIREILSFVLRTRPDGVAKYVGWSVPADGPIWAADRAGALTFRGVTTDMLDRADETGTSLAAEYSGFVLPGSWRCGTVAYKSGCIDRSKLPEVARRLMRGDTDLSDLLGPSEDHRQMP